MRHISAKICIFIEDFLLGDANSLHPPCLLRRSPLSRACKSKFFVPSSQAESRGDLKGNERNNPRRVRVLPLISLSKLLRRFGKYWQYGSKLKDLFIVYSFLPRSAFRSCFHSSCTCCRRCCYLYSRVHSCRNCDTHCYSFIHIFSIFLSRYCESNIANLRSIIQL